MVPVLNTIGTDVSCVGVSDMMILNAAATDHLCRTMTSTSASSNTGI